MGERKREQGEESSRVRVRGPPLIAREKKGGTGIEGGSRGGHDDGGMVRQ